jgi:hypothetical protein
MIHTVVRKVSFASAMIGAAVWTLAMVGPNSVPSAFAQSATSDAAASDAATPDATSTADASSADALPINIAGQWSGSMNDDNLGAGDFSINFDQTNKRLTIGWSVNFASVMYQGAGTGRSNSKKVTFKLTSGSFEKKGCKAKFTSMFASGTQIQGNYKWSGCDKEFGEAKDKGGSITITPSNQ